MSFNPLAKEAYKQAFDNGFYDYGEVNDDVKIILTKLLLINGEVAEATETLRKDQGIERFHEELADVMIRLLDLMGYTQMDVDTAIEKKMEYNKLRPYQHKRMF